MRSLWLISLVVLFLAGCVSVKPLHLTHDTSSVTRHASRVTKYTPPEGSHLFKATLDIRKHHLTGLLVIKRMDTLTPPPAPPQTGQTPPPAPPQTGRGELSPVYRIVFVNEVGMTFFDLEMKSDSFKVVSCFASLDKKALMKIFETDFRMLLLEDSLTGVKFFRQAETSNRIISGKTGKYKAWQTWSPSGDTLFSTAAKSTIADPVKITCEKYKDGSPLKITMENPFIGMKFLLRKLVQ
jgi:hypothetical protein